MTIGRSRSMAPRVVMASVTVLVFVAGCSGLWVETNQPPVSVTPAAVPDVGSTTVVPDPADISDDPGQFTKPVGLSAAHGAFLSNTSYSVVMTQSVHFPRDNRTGRWHLTGRFEPDGRFLVHTRRSGSVFESSADRVDYWSDGRIVYEAELTDESTTVNAVLDTRNTPGPPASVLQVDPRFEDELSRVLAMAHITSVNADRPSGRVQVSAIGPVNGDAADEFDFVRRVERLIVTIVIDESGFVRGYDLRYAGKSADQPVVVTRVVRYRAVGATGVEPPAWIAGATNATTRENYGNSSG